MAYDIEPEDDKDRIIKADYLSLDLEYKKGRCVIGNPPFGDRNNDLIKKFYNKSVMIGDYICFILPISQYKNDVNLFEFDLIYSENLGIKLYSNVGILCCLNIYKIPYNNILNKKPNYKLKDVETKRHTRNSNEIYNENFKNDIRICCFGSIGEVCTHENQYAKEYCIKINNEKYKDKIINIIKTTNWNKLYPSVSTPFLSQWQVYKYIKEQIPEIQ